MKSGISKTKIEITGRMTSRGADRVGVINAVSFLILVIGGIAYLLMN